MYSFFDTKVKLDFSNINNLNLSNTTTIKDYNTNNNCKKNILIIVNFDCEVNSKIASLLSFIIITIKTKAILILFIITIATTILIQFITTTITTTIT